MSHHIIIPSARSRISLAVVLVVVAMFGAWLNARADESLPSSIPDFLSVIHAHSDQLTKMKSDKDAANLFVSAIGPALGLGDAARTLGTRPLPAKLINELLVPDLAEAAHRLMTDLAAWRLAFTIEQALKDQQLATVTEQLLPSSQTRIWLNQQGHALWYDSFNQLSDMLASPEWAKENQGESGPSLMVTQWEHVARLEMNAMQAAYQDWDRIRNWKDRVRELRGQARLCGTWQWTIHNHQQNHLEQKFSLRFPPSGNMQTAIPGLAETSVLGENVYLRWEHDGRIQEDSLQFNKEGQRLEGTFVNSLGGWGSVSGKKTAGCTP
jgi:hypothetical protein